MFRHIVTGTYTSHAAVVDCSSSIFDDIISVTCSGIDELPSEENVRCSVDFDAPEGCKDPHTMCYV